MNVQLVSFRRPRHVIKGFPLEKKHQLKTLELPLGSQLLSAEDRSHDGTLMLWVLLPVAVQDTTFEQRTILVTFEREEFEVTEEEVSGLSFSLPNVYHIGMWVDRTVNAEGVSTPVTGHVLELLGDIYD